MRRFAPMAAAVAAAAVLGLGIACGGTSGGGSDRPIPSSPNVVVVRVVTRGGFAAETQQPWVPQVSVFGDGRVIITGPTTLEFPGPALPNLQEFRVNDDGLARILDEARTAGLLDEPPPDYGDAGITDQPTTTVTVRADGATHHVDVYALESTDGLTPEQRQHREQLTRFIQLIGDPDALREFVVRDTRRYEPTALAVIIRPSDTSDGETRPWPLDDLANAGTAYKRLPGTRCKVFDRGQLAAVLDAARAAREGDRWESAGATYTLQFRPLLPDQRGCGDLE